MRVEIAEGRASCRAAGQASLDETVRMVAAAITEAQARGAVELVADISGLTGLGNPSVAERFFAVERWADAGAGRIKLAIIARPELIDSRRFGATHALNRGLVAEIFASAEEAHAWLDRQRIAGGDGRRTRG